jgi:hypothetical protein
MDVPLATFAVVKVKVAVAPSLNDELVAVRE